LEIEYGADNEVVMISRVLGAEAHAKGSQRKRSEDSFEEYFMYLVEMEKKGWPKNDEHKSIVAGDKVNWQDYRWTLAEAGEPLDVGGSYGDIAAAGVVLQELLRQKRESMWKAKGECNGNCRLLEMDPTVEVTKAWAQNMSIMVLFPISPSIPF
jgi:hypothetical protein